MEPQDCVVVVSVTGVVVVVVDEAVVVVVAIVVVVVVVVDGPGLLPQSTTLGMKKDQICKCHL